MKRLNILHLIALVLLVGLVGSAPGSALADDPKITVQQLLQSIKQMDHKKPLTPEQQQSNEKVSRQALALMDEKEFVTPDHIQEIAVDVIAHRMALDSQAKFSGATAKGIVEDILKKIPTPA